MDKMSFAQDSTIRDLVNMLANPEDYVYQVLHNFLEWRKEYGPCFVAIGVSEKGLFPNYRFTASWNANDSSFEDNVFNGWTHRRMRQYLSDVSTHKWSAHLLTYSDVKLLLAQIRGHMK